MTPATPAFPENGYGIAKLAAGALSRLAAQQLGMRHIWVRVLSVYGPFDGENSMITSTLRRFLRGEQPQFTKGEQLWDYLYSEDAGDAFYLVGEKATGHKVYCLGSGESRTLKSYIEDIRDEVSPDAVLGFGEIPYASQAPMHLCADIRTLREDTGFAPKISFREGIRQTIRWMQG